MNRSKALKGEKSTNMHKKTKLRCNKTGGLDEKRSLALEPRDRNMERRGAHTQGFKNGTGSPNWPDASVP